MGEEEGGRRVGVGVLCAIFGARSFCCQDGRFVVSVLLFFFFFFFFLCLSPSCLEEEVVVVVVLLFWMTFHF